jgi:DNA helicase-4
MASLTQFREKYEEILAINQSLLRIESLRKKRDLLKIIIIGFFLYRDLETQEKNLHYQKKARVQELKNQTNDYFQTLKAEIDKNILPDSQISENKESQLLDYLNEFNKAVSFLMEELTLISEYEQIKNFVTDNLSAYLKETNLLKIQIVSHNRELNKKLLNQEISRFMSQLLQAEKEFDNLFLGELYFSKKMLHDWKLKWKQLVSDLEEFRRKATVLGFETESKQVINKVIDEYNQGESRIKNRNSDFLKKENERFEDFFDTIESNPLTAEQRNAIMTDEESVLIVAGAGTGKTSTIIGKVGYILKKRLAEPDEILILSFNAKVAEELRNRLSTLQNELTIKTYHSFGREIIASTTKVSPSVSKLAEDRIKLLEKISEFIIERTKDDKFAQILNDYFLYHIAPYKSEFEFNSFGEYIRYLRKFDLRSLKGDKVRSFEECYIANFLYANGIEYEYEKNYEVRTVDENYRQYKPDFYLPDYKIYVEHFGIDRNGKPASFISNKKYADQIEWKRGIHRENNTTLIETYSYEQKEGKLLDNLRLKLQVKGVKFSPIPQNQIFQEINRLGRTKQFILLLGNFLNLFKANGTTINQLKDRVSANDQRTQAFLSIFSAIFEDYCSLLKVNQEIDFNDMLIDAIDLIKQGKYHSNFRYILVDEFQDISITRYSFLKALQNQNEAKLFCVGDDWQSIYRFTGSDISIMVDFQKNFKFNEILTLSQTFRFNNKISDFSTRFILQNPLQIKKHLKTNKLVEKPAVMIVRGKTEFVLEEILRNLSTNLEKEATAYIIGRYNPKPEQGYLLEYPKRIRNLSIKYTTAHSSKGLEADYVIVVGLNDGRLGFPCQITDDPVLNLVLAREDEFPNAEERRLFYVAITRARKQVYLIYDPGAQESSFLTEVQNGNYEIESNYQVSKIALCPACKTGEIIEKKVNFYACNNFPYCDYVPKKCPKCNQGFLYKYDNVYQCSKKECSFKVRICPLCNEGYIVKKSNRHGGYFFACNRYPNCNYTESPNPSIRYIS